MKSLGIAGYDRKFIHSLGKVAALAGRKITIVQERRLTQAGREYYRRKQEAAVAALATKEALYARMPNRNIAAQIRILKADIRTASEKLA